MPNGHNFLLTEISPCFERSIFCFVCLSFIYGTFLWYYISFLIINTVWGILFRFDQNIKYLVILQSYGFGTCGEVLPILVWSLGFSDKVSFEGGIRDSSKEVTDPDPDSLCEPESEYDSDFDTESESESEASSELSLPTTSSIGAESCWKVQRKEESLQKGQVV